MQYTIGDVSKKLNLTTHTLRYYEKEGLLPAVTRSAGGVRVYSDLDISWLELIECLKETGMQLCDIKKFVDYSKEGDSSIGSRLEIMKNHKQMVEESLAQTEKHLKHINFKVWFYESALKAGTTQIQKPLTHTELHELIEHPEIYTKDNPFMK